MARPTPSSTAFRALLEGLGILEETAAHARGERPGERATAFWAEWFAPRKLPSLRSVGKPGGASLVVASGIPYAAFCAHHFTPFWGRATIAYEPGDRLLAASAPGKVLEHFAHRPTLQEELADRVATTIVEEGGARGAGCALTGRQLCVEMPGHRAGRMTVFAGNGTLAGARGVRRFNEASRRLHRGAEED